MKIKTSELTGAALDWAVAKCEGVPDADDIMQFISNRNAAGMFCYSQAWEQGGPIIERERIRTDPDIASKEWEAAPDHGMNDEHICYGSTLLIAAMRCYVASNMGEEIEIPEELK